MGTYADFRGVTQADGCARFGCLAENITTGLFAFFSIKMAIPDEGISYGLGTLKGRVKETQYNTFCNGEGAGLTAGNTTYTEGSLSLSFADDFNQRQTIDPTVARNIIKAIAEGSTFEYNGEKWSVIGTNGTRNIGTVANNLDHKYVFLEEGKVIVPDQKDADGNMVVETNNFITAYKKNNPIVFETLYAFADDQKKGDRMVYVLPSDYIFNEGSGADYNRYEITSTRYCDVKGTDKYLIDGLTDAQTLATVGTTALKRVEADIIIYVNGGGTPTVAGTSGQQAIVVDTADNTVELYKHDGTSWDNTAVTSTLASGAVIYSQSIDTALDGATAVNKAGLVVVKTAGATGVAVAITNKSNSAGSGTAVPVIDMLDWSFINQSFYVYTGTEA